ncbi:MAG: sigma 54-interacting transcriptional regulator [Desulfovibrionaceae bacterium]
MIHQLSGSALDQYFETLRYIVAELGPQRSFHASLRRILAILAQRHPFIRPHMVIYDPEARTLRLCVAGTPPATEGIVYEPGVGVTGQVFTMGQAVIVERIKGSGAFQNKFFTRTEQEMAELAFLCVPVFAPKDEPADATEVLGTLSVDMPRRPRAELEEACCFLEVVARLIGNQVAYFQQEVLQLGRVGTGPKEGELATAANSLGFIYMSKVMQQTLEQVARAGATRSNVLLYGETGTGKELLAELAHVHSARRHMPLQRVNCATLAPDKLELFFFGVQKGAFSWAVQSHKGILEQSHHGTLFLNGIEYLPSVLHENLLKAVREQEVLRLGASQPLAVNVRLICSTQKSVGALRESGLLPKELLQALSSVEIFIPPLREHPEDILPLAEHFLLEAAHQQAKAVRRMAADTISLLLRHAWLGNTRELKNCMARAVAQCAGEKLEVADLPPSLQKDEQNSTLPRNFVDAVAHFEQQLLIEALSRAKGNIVEAARLLSTSYRIIHYKITKYGINPKHYA